MNDMREITVEATLENIDTVTAWMDGVLEEFECSMRAQMQLDVALDELFSNIARYAYGEKIGTAVVKLERIAEENMVKLSFEDSGIPYDPLKKEDPDVTKSAEEREIGGLGIFLVKKTMDKMEYVYEDGKNKLSVWKRIG